MKKYISIMFLAIALDQISKGILLYLITGGVPMIGKAWALVPFPYMMARITNWFNIVFTWNPGTSFSLFRALGESAPVVIIALTALVIGFLGHYFFTRAKDFEKLPLALIIGGAIGNLIDRIRFGAVIDFLDFHVVAWHWPAFNIADICICLGVGLYVLNLIRNKKW